MYTLSNYVSNLKDFENTKIILIVDKSFCCQARLYLDYNLLGTFSPFFDLSSSPTSYTTRIFYCALKTSQTLIFSS